MYTSHLLYFTYSMNIKIIITGKHVLNVAPALTWLWKVLHTPKKVIIYL